LVLRLCVKRVIPKALAFIGQTLARYRSPVSRPISPIQHAISHLQRPSGVAMASRRCHIDRHSGGFLLAVVFSDSITFRPKPIVGLEVSQNQTISKSTLVSRRIIGPTSIPSRLSTRRTFSPRTYAHPEASQFLPSFLRPPRPSPGSLRPVHLRAPLGLWGFPFHRWSLSKAAASGIPQPILAHVFAPLRGIVSDEHLRQGQALRVRCAQP
jgi:hypothetical protein